MPQGAGYDFCRRPGPTYHVTREDSLWLLPLTRRTTLIALQIALLCFKMRTADCVLSCLVNPFPTSV